MGEATEKEKEKDRAKEKKPDFIQGVKSEFKKITWPDRQSTTKQSIAVVSVSVVLGIIIAVLDYVVQHGINFITSL